MVTNAPLIESSPAEEKEAEASAEAESSVSADADMVMADMLKAPSETLMVASELAVMVIDSSAVIWILVALFIAIPSEDILMELPF